MILIRADANACIGTGHVMRCLSIASAFKRYGEDVVFVTADHQGDALIGNFPVVCLNSIWNQMDTEIRNMQEIIKNENPYLLLVDSYYVTEKYFKIISRMVKTVYLDDLNKACWDVDYLINYNIFANISEYSRYKNTQFLFTPQYVPLREEFRGLSQHKMKSVTDIMVSAGGTDPENIISKIIDQICPCWRDITFHFIVGALNPRIDSIKQKESDNINNIIFHINEQRMSALMRECDIAISAAGSTLYELCACGTPTITYTLADNQITAAKTFEHEGIMLSAGDCREDEQFIQRLMYKMKRLITNLEERMLFSQKMQKLVDGHGAERIVKKLLDNNQFSK